MKFHCSKCGQRLEIETVYSGRTITCPSCHDVVTIPGPQHTVEAGAYAKADVQDLKEQTHAAGEPHPATDHGDNEADNPIASLVEADHWKRYRVGDVVATGGQGAIIDAKDLNVRRHVAMKTMLGPRKKQKEHILRFIQEAQLTGQLEHPSIVPLYELGVDTKGNVFYTMKMLDGITLDSIIDGIRKGDEKTIREYPLTHLISIFQKVCDAIAFAHAKGVIHRDLKPENIMVGEYGEVLVMDWGLAKIVRRPGASGSAGTIEAQDGLQPPQDSPGAPETAGAGGDGEAPEDGQAIATGTKQRPIDSLRTDGSEDVLKTVDGSIMGTPGYMAPEQADGKTDELDERSDIYSLGAILYTILTLRLSVDGKDIPEMLEKVTKGDIVHPRKYSLQSARLARKTPSPDSKTCGQGRTLDSEGQNAGDGKEKPGDEGRPPIALHHCPGMHIPDSVAAVAMKALELKPENRYQSVKALQKEITAYQSGFATSAEHASLLTLMRLFVHRHRAAAVATLSIAILLAASSWINYSARGAAEQSERRAVKALNDLRGTAPALAVQAKKFLDGLDADKALETITYAVVLVPDNADYRALRGNALQTMLRLEEAKQEYDKAMELNPYHRAAKENRDLCRTVIQDNRGRKSLSASSICQLHMAMRGQGRFQEASAIVRRLTDNGLSIHDLLRSTLKAAGGSNVVLKVDDAGLCSLSMDGIQDLSILNGMPLKHLTIHGEPAPLVSDLSPLKGMPLESLVLTGCRWVKDLSPLKDMKLKRLAVGSWNVGLPAPRIEDLSVLAGMPLAELNLQGCPVSDCSSLKGMPLKKLCLAQTQVKDLAFLVGMPLESLDISHCAGITDLGPLKSLPLSSLSVAFTHVSNFSVLKTMRLKELNLAGAKLRDLSPLNGALAGSLKKLSLAESQISDLSLLTGIPLTSLNLQGCHTISDLSPLKGMGLDVLILDGCPNIKDLTPLKGMRTLKSFGESWSPAEPLLRKAKRALDSREYAAAEREARNVIEEWRGVPAMGSVTREAHKIIDVAEAQKALAAGYVPPSE